jgi:predicted P-loop ATPase
MLITQGPQGRGKSTLPTLLWGDDKVVTILGKENQQKDDLSKYHMGKCISFEEFDTMYVSNIGLLKGVITNRADTFRKPYDSDNETHPRSCVFYASTNRHQFLKRDDTGYRRFAIVPFEQLDFDGIQRDREQLWAEAVVTFRKRKDEGNIFTLSEIGGTTSVAGEYAHEEDYIAAFEDWKTLAVRGLTARANIHEGFVYVTATEAYMIADINRTGKQEDKRSLKEHMLNTGWTFHKKWKEVPDKLGSDKRKRLEKVFIHPLQTE